MKKIPENKFEISIVDKLKDLDVKNRNYAVYFCFFPVYIIGFILIERFPFVHNYHVMHCALDDMIPFCEYFVVFYYAWHLAIAGFSLYAFRKDPKHFERLLKFFIVCCCIIFPIFILYPSCNELRPETIDSNNIFAQIVRWTYFLDTNTNVCPSMHVMGCIGLVLASWNTRGLNNKVGRFFTLILNIMICLSTLFLKQHSVIDVSLAFPVSLICWWLSGIDLKKISFRRKA